MTWLPRHALSLSSSRCCVPNFLFFPSSPRLERPEGGQRSKMGTRASRRWDSVPPPAPRNRAPHAPVVELVLRREVHMFRVHLVYRLGGFVHGQSPGDEPQAPVTTPPVVATANGRTARAAAPESEGGSYGSSRRRRRANAREIPSAARRRTRSNPPHGRSNAPTGRRLLLAPSHRSTAARLLLPYHPTAARGLALTRGDADARGAEADSRHHLFFRSETRTLVLESRRGYARPEVCHFPRDATRTQTRDHPRKENQLSFFSPANDWGATCLPPIAREAPAWNREKGGP